MATHLLRGGRRAERSSPRYRGSLPIACVGMIVAAAGVLPSAADGSPASRKITRDGFRSVYDLRFDESLAAFAEARRADAGDPAPLRAIAAVTWMEILFLQGVATYAAFQGSTSGDTVARPPVPPHLIERFSTSAQQALELAERAAAARPDDPDAQYQLGATLGLLALYRGTVEGRTFAAFMDGKRAVSIMKRIREKDPSRAEAALIPGMYRYAVSTLPWHKRLLATLAGLPGDKEGGIGLLETAAAESAETGTDAALVLMIAYNREGRHGDAMRHLQRLAARHPGNRLLRLNLASTALDAGEAARAADLAAQGHPSAAEFKKPPVTGERALWSYVRGASRAAIGDPRAEADLGEATREDSRDWIRARAHVELARLALRAGDVERGRVQIEAARYFGRRGRDDVAVARAEQIWRERRQS